MRAFIEVAKTNPKVYAELFFYKSIREANDIEYGYDDERYANGYTMNLIQITFQIGFLLKPTPLLIFFYERNGNLFFFILLLFIPVLRDYTVLAKRLVGLKSKKPNCANYLWKIKIIHQPKKVTNNSPNRSLNEKK